MTNGATALLQTPRVEPDLGKLKAAAERLSLSTDRIDSFLHRFHGPRGGDTASGAPQPPDTYRNDIETLFAQLDRLNEAVNALETVG